MKGRCRGARPREGGETPPVRQERAVRMRKDEV